MNAIAEDALKVELGRRYRFAASHRLHSDRLSEEENSRLYGKCNNPHGHGHNYIVEVTLEGDPDPVSGMVLDLKELKAILNREVVGPFDHRFLNKEVPPFDRTIPTVENIAIEIWNRIHPSLSKPPALLHSVRVYETGDLYVDYFGDAR